MKWDNKRKMKKVHKTGMILRYLTTKKELKEAVEDWERAGIELRDFVLIGVVNREDTSKVKVRTSSIKEMEEWKGEIGGLVL